ncbi:AAA family ATPase [Facklamia sp. 7083-14-GEN3]|uniref:ATP-binding protein n=1 Tax=Facklamia sp. 7083-14-GEN3 TaxID=2973478 RepID=UPI00215BBDDB|nr:AAA family ATPase [Facklamia sp. 7083-14-GEN3]MCR8968632.1 AAA family ATPase [Facklamia sp. 7083-14-GEN3]
MKISTLDIYGYGKWVNQRFDLDDQLQLIFGQNEAGKSTLQSFIRSILFGFPSKHRRVNQINRYEPKLSEVYGGRILLRETSYGDIWVERTNKGLSLTDTQGRELDQQVLDQILGGLDENLFDSFYAFSLQNLQELSNVDAEKLGDYFLSIGTVGSDKFLSVAKYFEKDLGQLYKLKGKNPKLNQALLDYEELSQSIEKMKQNMSKYDELFDQQQAEMDQIEALNHTIQSLEEKQRQLDQLMTRFDIYQKDIVAQRELEQLVYTKMEEDLPEKLEEAIRVKAESQKTIQQMEERIRNLNHEMSALTRLNWGKNHEDQRRQWSIATAHIKEVNLRLEHVLESIQEQTNTMARLAREGQFYPEKVKKSSEFDREIEQGYEIQAMIDDLEGQKEALQAERKVFLDQRKELQTYSVTVRQQHAKLESMRMNEKAQLQQVTNIRHYFVGALSIVLGFAIGGYHLLNQTGINFRWIALILIGVGILSSAYVFFEHQKYKKQFHSSPAIEKMAELQRKERQYQERSQELGQDINQREANLRSIEEELVRKKQEQQRWLVALGFYPTADAEMVLKSNPVKEYFQAETIRQQYEEERNNLNLEIAKWRKQIVPLLERFPLGDQSIKVLIHHIEETEVSIARQVERGKAMEERINNAQDIISQEEKNLEQQNETIKSVYQSTNSFDEVDFRQKVQANNQIQQLKEKRDLYSEQIKGYENEMSAIDSKQSLINQYNKVQNELTLNKSRVQPHQYQRANIEVALNQLEQDGSYQVLQQKLEDKKAEIIKYVQEWSKKKIAVDLIYQTLRQGMDNPIPEMNKMANEIFSKLTYGRYDQIKLNKTGIKVKQFSDVLFSPHELSQGTLEQLYVALRLAFIANASSMVSMPIIIDDAFVNFDEIRKASMYKVLETISQDHQVLFFTFDQMAAETLAIDSMINLDELIEMNSTEEES